MSGEKEIYALVHDVAGDICVTTVDSTGTITNVKDTTKGRSCKTFVAEMPKIFTKKIKVVIFNIFLVQPTNFTNNYEFQKAIKAMIVRLKIPYVFISLHQYVCARFLTGANVAFEMNDTVLIVLVKEHGIYATELKKTLNGYKSNSDDRSLNYDSKESDQSIRKKIVGSSTPKKILISSDTTGNPILKKMIDILNFKDLIFLECDKIKRNGQVISEMAKHVLDKSYTKFWVLPKTNFNFGIRCLTGNKTFDLIYFGNENLPAKKEIYISRQSFNLTLFLSNGKTTRDEILETFTPPMNCHKVKLILSVDSNNFPSYKAEPIMIPKVMALPDLLTRFVSSKVPVIGFFENSSVICHHKDGNYQFLVGWNGAYGRDLLISFATEKPKFMEDAVEALRTKPSYVVLDLIRIMSMPSNDIKHDGPSNFKFTKDTDNPVLLEFDNADGSLGAASPAFLMAMLMKEHLIAIKDESGEKPTNIAFCLLDYPYNAEERNRIVDQINEAGKLLKIKMNFLPFIV
uniref:Uncharacterized protein n=1 Tax=Panagrolaimus sp. ES5 TaxID=591445 RepID=A0AC34F0A5_9BILA